MKGYIPMKKFAAILFAIALMGCGATHVTGSTQDPPAAGETGPQGGVGAPGHDGITPVIQTAPEPAGENCAAGGTKITITLDRKSVV